MCLGRMMIILGLCISAVIKSSAGENGEEFYVKEVSLQCVATHINDYLTLDQDPVLIFFDVCPKTIPSDDDVLDGAVNSLLPSVKVQAEVKKLVGVKMWPLRKNELLCIKDKWLRNDYQKITSGEESLVKVTLSGCAAYDKEKKNE